MEPSAKSMSALASKAGFGIVWVNFDKESLSHIDMEIAVFANRIQKNATESLWHRGEHLAQRPI